ncbi:MAG: response regulator transcription factor [Burkholderiaceae bacterium]
MRILIADDHPLVREALVVTVMRAVADAQVRQAHDFDSLAEACEAWSPALALVDLNMPGMNALEGLRMLRRRHPTMAVLVASAQEDPPTIRAVLATGVNGFFPKTGAPELLRNAIQLVLAGESYVPPGALGDFLGGEPPHRPDVSGLTPRQHDVLMRLLQGHPNKLIARDLGLTEGTVKIHIAAILRALGARNRTEAVVRAHELGLDGAES